MGTDAAGFALVILAIGVSFVGFRTRHLVACLGASGLWVALMVFLRDNASSISGANREIVMIACIALAVAMLLFGVFRGIRVRNTNEVNTPYDENEHSGVKGFIHKLNADEVPKPPRGGKSQFYESEDEHRERVRRALGRDRTRRRMR